MITMEEVKEAHPWWHLWVGVAGIKYARRNLSSPPIVVRGETWDEIKKQIVESGK